VILLGDAENAGVDNVPPSSRGAALSTPAFSVALRILETAKPIKAKNKMLYIFGLLCRRWWCTVITSRTANPTWRTDS